MGDKARWRPRARAGPALPKVALLLTGVLLLVFLLAASAAAALTLAPAAAPIKTGSSSIKGTVTSAATAKGVAGVTVTAFRKYAPDPVAWPDWFQFEPYKSALSSSKGAYSITGLPAGTYRVEFRPAAANPGVPNVLPYAIEAWNDKAVVDWAGDIVLGTKTARTGINAALEPAGTLRGTVTEAGSGDPLAGIRVTISYQGFGIINRIAEVTTGADGSYRFTGLKTYPASGDPNAIGFFPWAWDDSGWHADVLVYDAGGNVPNTGDRTKIQDVVLDPAGWVHGRVLAPGGAPAAGVTAEVWMFTGDPEDPESQSWEPGANLTTEADGTYTLKGVKPGAVRILFSDPPQWRWARASYKDDPPDNRGGPVAQLGSDVTVTAGEDTAVPDVTLSSERGAITGFVRNLAGTPLQSCDVMASIAEHEGEWNWVAIEYALADGSYRLDGLPHGDYTVLFNGQQMVPNLSAWYEDDFLNQSPTLVTVGESGTIPRSVDQVLPLPSHIKGTVKGQVPGGLRVLGGIDVTVWIQMGFNWWQEAAWFQTDDEGRYDATLPAGTYKLSFSDQNGAWVTEYWNNSLFEQDATTVTVGAWATLTGISPVLAPAGHITGTVYVPAEGSEGYGPEDIEVLAWRVPVNEQLYGPFASVQCTGIGSDTEAVFDLGGLPYGEYVLVFGVMDGPWLEWWQDQPDWTTATSVWVDQSGQWWMEPGGDILTDIYADLSTLPAP